MRNGIFVFLIGLFLASCGGNEVEKSELSDSFTVSLDTVMVDAGEEFLFLQDNLFMSELSVDGSYLINFNRQEVGAERINLDDLKLDYLIPLEKEGPNGIPQYVSGFLLTPEEYIFIWNYRFYKIFDQKGQLIKDLELEKLAPELLGGSDIYPSRFYLDPKNPNRLIGHFVNWEDKSYFLIDFDLESSSYTEIELPFFEKTQVYNTDIMFDGRWMGSYGPGIYPTSTSEKVILATNVINEVQVFDFSMDSLYTKGWDTPLLGSKRTYLPPKEVDGQTGEIEEIRKLAEEDISYGPLVWDKEEQKFYRFSTKSYFGEEKDEYGSYVPTRSDVFLSVFDENLDLLGEALIPEMNSSPKRHFVKEGKIWIFENIEDELGFVRVTVK
jgi:hypothetical protein